MKKLLIALLLLPFAIQAQSWNNVGSAGFSPDSVDYTASSISIAINSSGTPYVVYGNDTGYVTVMKYNGSSWVVVGSAGFSAGIAMNPSIAIDGSGTPYVVYGDISAADGYSGKATVKKFNGSSWVTVGSIGFSGGEANCTSIAIDGSGIPYVVYVDGSAGISGNAATVMKFNGSSWINVGSAGFSYYQVYFTTIAIDGSGTPYVVYQDGGIDEKATVMKYNGISWVAVGGSCCFSAGAAWYTSIAIDGSGMPFVVYQDRGNGYKATVMKYNGSSWVNVGSAGFSATEADWTSIAIDGSGTPYVAYQDYASGQKASVMKYSGTSWIAEGSPGFSGGQAINTSIAIDGSGTPYVDYVDGSVGSHVTVMRFGTTPSPITGSDTVCLGATTSLSDITTGGTWSSSNTSIATIDTGTGSLTGIAGGTDTISYTVSGISTTFIITVNPLPLSGTISGMDNLCVGSTITLSNTSLGGVWSSSNNSLATISTGVVNGLVAGVDTIKYTVTNICGIATATKTLTINPLPVAGTITGADTICIGDTISLLDAMTGGDWITSNGNAFVSSTGAVYGVTAGIDNISYTVTNSCGTASVDTTINILNCTTEIKKISNQSTPFITIFPNPNRGAFTVNISTLDNDEAQIIITNFLGEKVKELRIATNKETDVQLQSPAGIYFISAVTKNGSITNKIFIE